MARANLIQTNFTSGEISPLMRGRVDTTRYANGAEKIENFIVKPQGGAWRRSGTRFTNVQKFPDHKSIIISFIFSSTQSYVLEFGETYVRFYKDGGIIVDGGGSPVEVVTPYLQDDLSTLYFCQSADILYVCHPNYPTMQLERFSHTDWRFIEFETFDGPYMSSSPGGFAQVSVTTDSSTMSSDTPATFVIGDVGKFVEYRENNVFRLARITGFTDDQHVTVDVLDEILLGLDPTSKLTAEVTPVPANPLNFGGGSGTLAVGATAPVAPFNNSRFAIYRYVTPNVLTTQAAGVISSNYTGVFTTQDVGKYVRINNATWWKITVWNASDNVSATSAAPFLATGAAFLQISGRQVNATVRSSEEVFDSVDIGRKMRLEFSGQQVWGTITQFNNTKEVLVNFRQDLPLDPNDPTKIAQNGITDVWKLGAWSKRTGYPSIMVFHEQRATLARTNAEPQTIWASRSGDYPNFAPTEPDSTVLDDSAVTYTIASNQANGISWLESGPVLLIGTLGGEWQAKAASTINEPITPSNLSVLPGTGHGSSPLARPRRIGSAVLFVQRSGRKVRELTYDYAIDSYVAKNLNIVAEHMLRRGGNKNRAIQTAFQQEPNNILWVVLQNGELVGMTYEKDQEVVAWHVHPIGGVNVSVESIAVVPSVDGTEDALYMIVRRYVNGTYTRYLEMLEREFEPANDDDKDEMFFVDCGLSYRGAPTTTITGLDHLEKETVSILADGHQAPDQQVIGGEITLTAPASVVHVGYSFRSLIKTLPLEGGSQAGTSQGKIKRATKVDVRLYNSIGFKHGSKLDQLTEESFRSTNDPMNSSPKLKTEDRRVSLDQGYTNDGGYYVIQDSAYPLVVLALMPQIDTYE